MQTATQKVIFKKDAYKGRGYEVWQGGVRIGFVNSSWRKVYGGACWYVSDVDGSERYFTTRKDAAVWLSQMAQASA